MKRRVSGILDPADDAPELTAEFFRTARISIGTKVIRYGLPHKKLKLPARKQPPLKRA